MMPTLEGYGYKIETHNHGIRVVDKETGNEVSIYLQDLRAVIGLIEGKIMEAERK